MEQGTEPYFFKIILPCILEDHKFRIPPKFMKKYGHDLAKSDSIYLQVSKCSIWEVKLMRYKGHVWIYKGWQEFAEYYSIAFGYLVVFKYEGNSKFQVIIFDHSATVIEYQVNDDRHIEQDDEMDCREPEVDGAPNIDDHEEEEARGDDDDISIEILDDFPPSTIKPRAKAKEGCVQAATVRAKKRKDPTDACGSPQSVQAKRSHGAWKEASRGIDFPGERSHTCTAKTKDIALQRAEALKCNGPSFLIQLRKYHVSSEFRVHIPNHHVREYFRGKQKNVVLIIGQGPEKKTWTVSIKYHIRANSTKLEKGWKDFALHNHLVIGDVCVFELIKKNTYKVFIFRAAEDGRQVQRTKASENPDVRVIMRPSYIRGTLLTLPRHAQRYFLGKENKVISLFHGTNGKSWDVSCYLTEQDQYRFHSGWRNFARDNNLQVGDVCVFEPMINDRQGNSYKVTILRRT